MEKKLSAYFLQTNIHNIWWNLATEKYLSRRIGDGDVLLYLWQNEKTVVIGRNQNAFRECRTKLLEQEGGRLARRETGGGAVYHDLGNLCFTFIANSGTYNLEKQFAVIQDACSEFGIKTKLSGRNDILTEDGLKFSGNAFSAGTECRIHHGTLMLSVNRNDMSRYLCPSKQKMQAKGITSVRSRVCNLCEINSHITMTDMRGALYHSFQKRYGNTKEIHIEEQGKAEIEKIYDLYQSWEWKYGKTPEYTVAFSEKFVWGEVEVKAELTGMRIRNITVYSDALDIELPEKIQNLLNGKRYDMEDVTQKDIELMKCSEEQKECIYEVIKWLTEVSAR